ncbi:TlpA disulfide reductase family protein [Pedobacter sp. Du54]|uniref:TlpA family protein disulfide reductase n=1 Tax=Pedobacter anseongensis TaxID=3133439 RepID=UPI0030A36D44
MKKLLFLLLSLICVQLQAQQVSLALEDKKMDAYLMERKLPTLTIQINRLPDSVKKVPITYTLVQIGVGMQTTRYAETDEAGMVKIVFDQNFPNQQAWLSVGDYLYAGIYVNDGLTVTIDASKLPKDGAYMIGDGVVYSGVDGQLNTVMNKNVLFRKKEKEALSTKLRDLSHTRKKYTSESFFVKVDSIKMAFSAINNEFIANFKNYAWAIKNETLSEMYGNLCVSYWGDVMPDALFKEISTYQPRFTSNDGVLFYRYLDTYTRYLKTGNKDNTLAHTLLRYDSLYTQQKSDILKLVLLESEKDVFSRSYATIINSIKVNWCKKQANDELLKANLNQKRIDNLFASSTKIETATIGTPLIKMPFDAELYRLDNIKSIDDFLINLKQKFPNKAFIFDFWATWCGPCLSDLPSSKKLHEANKDLAVEYIYLCTSGGSNIDAWKNKVADLQIPGTHIFVDEKIIAQLKGLFNASSGFPAYVVMDAKGQVNAKSITRMGALNRESLKMATGL